MADLSQLSDADLLKLAAQPQATPPVANSNVDLSSLSNADLLKLAGQQALKNQPSAPSFLDRYKADQVKRDALTSSLANQAINGSLDAIPAGVNIASNYIAGPIADLGNEAGVSALNALSSVTPDSWKAQAGSLAKSVGLDSLAKLAGQKYDQATNYVAQNYPDAAAFGRSAGDILGAEGVLKPLAAVTKAVGPTAMDAAVQTAADDIPVPKSAPEPAPLNADQNKSIATAAYQKADELGGQLPATNTDNILTTLKKELPNDHLIEGVHGKDEADKLIEKMAGTVDADGNVVPGVLQGKDLSLSTIQKNDVILNNKISLALRAGDNNLARKLGTIKDAFLDEIDNVDPAQSPGGVEGFNAWNQAKHAFAKQASLRQIEEIVETASNMTQPANSMASRFNTLLRNKNRLRGYSDDEIALMKQIASTSKTQALKQVGASGLMKYSTAAVGGSLGGLPGYIAGGLAGHVGSSILKDVAASAKLDKINELYKLINAREAPADIAGAVTPALENTGGLSASPVGEWNIRRVQ